MIRALGRRALSLLLALIAASVVIFVMLQAVPGDPAAFMLGMNASEDAVAALRAELGLEGPLAVRYLAWISGMLGGDFGTSYTYRVPVAELVSERIVVSAPLAVMALVLSTVIAIPVGLIAAARRGGAADWGIMGGTQLGIAVPNFWFAMLLVLVFAVKLRWVSAGGFPGWDAGLWPGVRALLLPAIALALPQASILARVLRSALLDTLDQDYIRTARAKGVGGWRLMRRHVLRNAMNPVLTAASGWFASMLAGAVFVEFVFGWNGMGLLMFRALEAGDLPVVMGGVMVVATVFVAVNMAVDAMYGWLDPRVRMK